MENPRVYIIISNYQGLTNLYEGKPLIKVCLDNLLSKTKYKNYKVIVGDDNSTDNSVAFIKKTYPNVAITIHKPGMNSARNNNVAVRSIKEPFDFILFMSNDIIVKDGNWLTKLIKDANETKADVMGCKLLYPDGKIQHAGMVTQFPPYLIGRGDEDKEEYSSIRTVDGVTAAVMLIRKSVIKKIGLLTEQNVFGYEDVDYCINARKEGFEVVYDGEVSLIHLEGATTNNSKIKNASFLYFYYNQLAGIYFVRKNLGLRHLPYLFIYEIAYSIISVEGKDRKRGLSSIRLKSNPLKRIHMTLKAWNDYILGKRNPRQPKEEIVGLK